MTHRHAIRTAGEEARMHLSLSFELSLLHDSLDIYQMESDLSPAQEEAVFS